MTDQDLLDSLRGQIRSIEHGTSGSAVNKSSRSSRPYEAHRENASFARTRVQSAGVGSRGRKKASSASSKAQTAAVAQNDEGEAAFKKIVVLINVQERSTAQLAEKLARAGFSEKAAQEALERATRCGLVDDRRYADLLIRSRIAQGMGTAGIERELKKNGIAANQIEELMGDFAFSYDDDFARALSLLEKHPPRSKNLREGAYRKLMQKGFTSTVASDVARTWFERVEQSH